MFRTDQSGARRARLRRSTLAVTAGRGDRAAGEPLNVPPVFASAYRAGAERTYARDGNPTWEAFERALGALEGGTAVAFPSGMAAVAAVVADIERGARVVVADSAYVEVREALAEREAEGGLSVSTVDATDTDAAMRALAGTDLLWLDTLSNPGLEVPEIDRLTAAAHAHGTTVVVDATLATPILQRPLELGADLVLHSATKHIGGHSDLLLGAAVAADPLRAERLRAIRTRVGAAPGTLDAWLALRGLRTLPLRIERGQRTAGLLAERLATHPAVTSVRYPGLAADPAHATASRLLDGFGTVISFEVEGGAAGADAVCRALRVITHATSLGGVETVIERHGNWHAEPGIAAGLLRLSVGCEHPDDLWADLESALAAAGQRRARRVRNAYSTPEPAKSVAVSSSQRPRNGSVDWPDAAS